MPYMIKSFIPCMLALAAYITILFGYYVELGSSLLFTMFLLEVVYLGSEAEYWRMRSKKFYLKVQSLIDAGKIQWKDAL